MPNHPYFFKFSDTLLDNEWIKTLLSEAKTVNPSVTDTVVEHINKLLHTQFTEQQITTAELKNISTTLLQEMGIDLLEKGQGK